VTRCPPPMPGSEPTISTPNPRTPSHPREAGRQPISLAVRLLTLAVITVPALGLVAGAVLMWGWGFSWADLGLLVGMYVLTGLGITVGFHRLFTHGSFETTPGVKFVLAVLGTMAIQAPLFKWVAVHRRHHQHSDDPDDPHSPHYSGPGLLGGLRGYWHSHIGWFFAPEPTDLDRYAADLRQSSLLSTVEALSLVWVALGLLIPAGLGGVIAGDWMGFWSGLVWGGLVRVFIIHHVTWSVNSACHLWGSQPFRSGDESRNNFAFGVLGLGEGWHNNHHAFPTSARHGLRWWEVDLSYWVIRALAATGLAWQVKLPSAAALGRAGRAAGVSGREDDP
jgi:stearoyl-CoA desaturase (delta-9 desaturase)